MRYFFSSIILFILSATIFAQEELVLTTEKLCGDKIISNKWVTSFEKINNELDSFIFDDEIFTNPSLFRLELLTVSNKEIYIYGMGMIKDTICYFILDSNNDKNFKNDEIVRIPINKDNANPVMIGCKYDGGSTWIQLLSAKTDKDNNLSRINFKICEYRMAMIAEDDLVYRVRIEPRLGIDYSNPYLKLEGSDEKTKLHLKEYLCLNDNRYLIKYSNIIGDTIILERINKDSILTSTQIGFTAPDLVGKSIKGANINLKDFRGKYVLLDFWYLGCGACLAEMKYFVKDFYELYGGEKFEILGVNVEDNCKLVSDFTNKNDYTWPQMLSSLDGDFVSRYGVFAFPTYYLIDTNGYILENDFWGIANLPYLLNNCLPDDYLYNKLLTKKNKFVYDGYIDSKYSSLEIKPLNGKIKNYGLLKYNNKWQYSLDLPNGEYLYYFYFDGKNEIDPNNPNKKEVDGQVYSILIVDN